MISIVVPVYNAEKYLNKCIESILAQTYQNWELVLVDNGSTDGSMALCKSYAEKDIRITAFHQHQNKGVSVARNLGLEKCSGEYITFVDADDWIKEDYLERLIDFQKEQDADMVVCRYERVYDKDRNNSILSHVEQREYKTKIYDSKQYLEHHFLEGNPSSCFILYKSELLEQLKFPTGITIGEDMLFVIEVVLRAGKIVITDYAGYQYYFNSSGAMLKKFTPSYMDQIVCWEKALDRIKEVYPELAIKVESILVVSVLLVVGKLSELDTWEREQYQKEIEKCYHVFAQYGRKKEITKYLPKGYLLKIYVYGYFPKVYMALYGKLRRLIWSRKK